MISGARRSVTKESPCPVCKHDSYCLIDEKSVFCYRESAGAVSSKLDRNGKSFHVHVLTPNGSPLRKADAAVIHDVYVAFLWKLQLTDSHRQSLLARGLRDEDIKQNVYRSIPHYRSRPRIAGELRLRFGDSMYGVPGFFTDEKGIFTFVGPHPGIYIPVGNSARQIQGLRTRRDSGDKNKYAWFSSSKMGGIASGAPAHVGLTVRPGKKRYRGAEGEFKADVSNARTDVPTIGIPGAESFDSAISELRALQAETVLISYDADASTNKNVAAGLAKFAEKLKAEGFAIELERWPLECGKGIDDVLNNGNASRIEVITGDAASEAIREIVSASGIDPDGVSPATDTVHEDEPITNYEVVKTVDSDGKEKVDKIPLSMTAILGNADKQTGNWPRAVASRLFVPSLSDSGISLIESQAAMFGFYGTATGKPPCIMNAEGFHQRDEIYQEKKRTATRYKAVESMPHEPPIDGHYYACDFPEPGDGTALRGLIERFSCATDVDEDLLTAVFVTPLWGGDGGTRPAVVFTADAGRGSGKSRAARMLCRLYGHIELSSNEDIGVIKQRLLSGEGLTQRIALLDNVKSNKFSWAELEALITAPVISGKAMYIGESRRPNTLTYVITLNGVSLSTDMSQRCIVVKLKKPVYSADWEEETQNYIDKNRDGIIADGIAFLRNPVEPLPSYTRWGSWEKAVLSRVPEPVEAQKVIAERQAVADVESEESTLIEEFFEKELLKASSDTKGKKIFIPSAMAVRWWTWATGEKGKSNAIVSRMLNQSISEGKFKHLAACPGRGNGRGFLWVGEESIPNDPQDTDLETRMNAYLKHRDESAKRQGFYVPSGSFEPDPPEDKNATQEDA